MYLLSLDEDLFHCCLKGINLGASDFTVGIKAFFKTYSYYNTGIHLKMATPRTGTVGGYVCATLLLVEVTIKASRWVENGRGGT